MQEPLMRAVEGKPSRGEWRSESNSKAICTLVANIVESLSQRLRRCQFPLARESMQFCS